MSAKEYETRHDWVGKVIHWELCKKLKFDHTIKWYMHKSKSVQENEKHNIPWDFEIQTDTNWSPNLGQKTRFGDNKKKKKKKENVLNCGLWRPSRPQSEDQRKQNKILPENKNSYETWRWPWYQS